MNQKVKICHIITNLGVGGAELMLKRLIKAMEPKFESIVIALGSGGPLKEKFEKEGIEVHCLNMTRSPSTIFLGFLKLKRILKRFDPHIVQAWMYHANLIAALIKLLMYDTKFQVFWGIRQTNLSPQVNKRATMVIAKLGAILSSPCAKQIIYCSAPSKETHEKLGYAKKGIIIPNGYDLTFFYRRENAKAKLCNRLNIPTDSFLIGNAGRFDPQKDHLSFIDAAKIIEEKVSSAYFIMAGKDILFDNKVLAEAIGEKTKSKFRLLGDIEDMPEFYSALDIYASASLGESFPNTLAEAMACETPCIATNVGASQEILGEETYIIPPKAPNQLALKIINFLEEKDKAKNAFKEASRKRIRERFEISMVAQKYERTYLS